MAEDVYKSKEDSSPIPGTSLKGESKMNEDRDRIEEMGGIREPAGTGEMGGIEEIHFRNESIYLLLNFGSSGQ